MEQNFQVKTNYVMTNNDVRVNFANFRQSVIQQTSFRIMFVNLGRFGIILSQDFLKIERPHLIGRLRHGAKMVHVRRLRGSFVQMKFMMNQSGY